MEKIKLSLKKPRQHGDEPRHLIKSLKKLRKNLITLEKSPSTL
jgi:hypothetical protein